MRRGVKRADAAMVIVLVLLLGGYTVAQVQRAQEMANRVRCASNLRQIGQAMLLYSNENRGAYPRTLMDLDKPTPTWGTPYEGNEKLGALPPDKALPFDTKNKKSDVAPAANDVTAAFFLLLRTQDITSAVFTCPSTGNEPWNFGGGQNVPVNWSNWPGAKVMAEHLDYSYQNPYPTRAAIAKGWKLNNSVGAEFALAGDINPGVDALTQVKIDAPPTEMVKINSPNHGGEGQNVLFGDGHVSFESTPYVGVNRDNIYTYGDSGAAHQEKSGDGIVGASVGPQDSILLPTAKDLGVVDAQGKLSEAAQRRRTIGVAGNIKPGTPAERDAIQKKLMGTYVRKEGAQKIRLAITPDKIVGTAGAVTITFDYKISGVDKDVARFELTAPETDPSAATLTADADGGITIHGSVFFEGKWARQ